MRVILCNQNKISKTILPQKIDGSFWVVDEFTNNNIINIEAEHGKWIMKSNEDARIKLTSNIEKLVNNTLVQFELMPGKSCYIEYEGRNLFAFIENDYDNTFGYYTVGDNTKLIFGSNEKADICYSGEVNKECFMLENSDNGWNITMKENALVYINDYLINESIKKINYGDNLFIYGVRIVLYKNMICINNIENKLKLNGLKLVYNNIKQNINFDVIPINSNSIKEVDLYKDEDYFFKKARIRRFVETYKLKVTPPPSKQVQEEMPFWLVVGPTLTMSIISVTRFLDVFVKIYSGQTSLKNSMSTLITSVAMLLGSLLWPNLTRIFQKRMRKKQEKYRVRKYRKYIDEKKNEISKVIFSQTEILKESLVTIEECQNIIIDKKLNLWERRSEHKDYLTVRLGIGDCPADIEYSFPEEDFTLQEEDELRIEIEKTLEDAKMLKNVPIGYSFNNKKVTALMGKNSELFKFTDSILLQLLTFHSYEDLKIIFFVSKRNLNVWNKYKDLFHCFSNNKNIRYFATNLEEANHVSSFLEQEFYNRMQNIKADSVKNELNEESFSPYYLIVTDDYPLYRRVKIMNTILKVKNNCGFSLICVDTQLRRLPSECVNFVYTDGDSSTMYCTKIDEYFMRNYRSETNYSIDISKSCSELSNIPIEFDEEVSSLPTMLGFLEMFRVGKVEQLNILNRWRMNNPIQSLRAQVGITSDGNPIYLDLHEKYHGPHGLIAGTTGSGKSEFIITYILSLALNFSPEEVAFILIDYKGGGLAGAFENKTQGIRLPHLAGTITNLDKASLNRTLVSIESELKRRQKKFNDVRDELGESTIDIYKYQKFYRDKKIKDPMPHLFIISDEFAELKAQQPEFMDDLISTARIGRSLGIHLILATQKPSGVVNDQIWSNTKFRVCLKVQDVSDSKGMLNSPDAAYITNAGRFFLQVGNNEIFVLGQSGWAGNKYIASNEVKRQYDRTLDFIDGIGNIIVKAEDDNKPVVSESNGDELSNVLKTIVGIANRTGVKTDNLWLDAIPENIYVDDIIKKYNYQRDNNVIAVIGEYDAPTKQMQDILTLKLNEEGNTLVYGLSGTNREMFISSLIYSLCTGYSTDKINLYVVDFGSESLRIYNKFPQVGDVVFYGEDEKFNKLFKMLEEELLKRKKMFVDYNGEYNTYLKLSGSKLPLIIVTMNNYDYIKDTYSNVDETISKLVRDGERYGIIFVISLSSQRVMYSRISNNFHHQYVLDMKDKFSYVDILGKIGNVYPTDYNGRGLYKSDIVYEFQTAQVCPVDNLIDFITKKSDKVQKVCPNKAPKIPTLPDRVTIDDIIGDLTDINNIPIGIIRSNLKTYKYNFFKEKINILSSKKLDYVDECLLSIIYQIRKLNNMVVFIDVNNLFGYLKDNVNNYVNNDFSNFISKLEDFISNKLTGNIKLLCIISGVNKIKNVVGDSKFIGFINTIKNNDFVNILIVDEVNNIKSISFENWFVSNINKGDGIWVSSGFSEQSIIGNNVYSNIYKEKINNQYAWVSNNGDNYLIKIVGGGNNEE